MSNGESGGLVSDHDVESIAQVLAAGDGPDAGRVLAGPGHDVARDDVQLASDHTAMAGVRTVSSSMYDQPAEMLASPPPLGKLGIERADHVVGDLVVGVGVGVQRQRVAIPDRRLAEVHEDGQACPGVGS